MGRPVAEAELRRAMARDPHNDLAPPSGMFLVARDGDGVLLGCVGVRLLPGVPETAELKRMFVRPAGRGTGLGRGLLVAAETAAQELGATRMVCETNSQLAEARALYAAHAYEEIPPSRATAEPTTGSPKPSSTTARPSSCRGRALPELATTHTA
ncbi:GNAT family N-acetyltransferase [Streptomyces sp. LHD-70]|uniref:GNAT family N-acetyltransferase n=1 Tax=Streptomyces sp. LHD-70 TaxID=3072140 RepID=UPI00280D77BC|nr:GNAT family N-acetyltransferase [Streptomyces sp. LHD-70]MDQ8708401.1 GNAT family N-acetyltransferase [Streptomyces sp. LHD-70]